MSTNTELFLGNQRCIRCYKLEGELETLRAEMDSQRNKFNQLELEYYKEREVLEEEKKDREMKITELRETDARLRLLDPIRVNELQQQIATLMKEKNEVETQLRSEKEKVEKELTVAYEKHVEELKEKLVKAVRRREQLKKANKDSSQLIEELEKKHKTLVTENKHLLSKIKAEVRETDEWDKLKAERDELYSDRNRLDKEAKESRLKCKTLEEEIIKCRNVVNRKYI